MAAAAASSSSLQNIYYERKTGTARPCYICNRPTTTVLATIKTEDYLYTCEGHLTDSGFASPIPTPASTPGPSADDIKKVIADYHQREARKGSKGDNDKDKDKADKDKDKDKQEKEKEKEKPTSGSLPSTPSIPTSTTPQPPTHRKFQLHRHIFEMRKNELRRKEQGNKAKEVSRGLPQVPRTAF